VAQVPKSILQPAYPLTALIANNYGEMMSIPLYDSALMLSALVLLTVVIAVNLASREILRQVHNASGGGKNANKSIRIR
jgi:phosphate transport system permease protein